MIWLHTRPESGPTNLPLRVASASCVPRVDKEVLKIHALSRRASRCGWRLDAGGVPCDFVNTTVRFWKSTVRFGTVCFH